MAHALFPELTTVLSTASPAASATSTFAPLSPSLIAAWPQVLLGAARDDRGAVLHFVYTTAMFLPPSVIAWRPRPGFFFRFRATRNKRAVAPAGPGASAYLLVAVYDVFDGGEFLQAHRPAGVELLRADAEFRAEPELPLSVKRVDAFTYTAAASTRCKTPAPGVTAGHDRLGVPGPVPVYAGDRPVQPVNDLYGQYVVEVIRGVVLVGRGGDPGR